MSGDVSLTIDGFEEAFVGWAQRVGKPPVAIYDYEQMVDCLMSRDGMTREDAQEFIEFNVEGAWLGEGTPMLLHMSSLKSFKEYASA